MVRREKRLNEGHDVKLSLDGPFDDVTYSFISDQKKRAFGDGFLGEESTKAFFHSLTVKLGDRLVFSHLKVDGKLAAAHMGFKAFGKYYYYIPAYDKEMSKMGVGAILLWHLIEGRSKELVFDFLRGDEDYKYDWSDDIRSNFNLYAYRKDCSRFAILKERIKASKKIRELLGR